ncbi:hypothetical protein ACLOJK_036815 [Asimina triloba]
MSADKRQKIIGARKCLEEAGVTQVSKVVLRPNPFPFIWECLATSLLAALSEARSRAEEELEASLEQHYIKGKGGGCRKGATPGLVRCPTRTGGLERGYGQVAIDLVASRDERDETISGAEAAREEASKLSPELASARSEAKALRVQNVDSDVNRVESHAELEAIRGEVSLLHGQVALLGSRDRAALRVQGFTVKLEASQAEVTCLRVESSQEGNAQSSGSVSSDSWSLVIAEYLRIDVHWR